MAAGRIIIPRTRGEVDEATHNYRRRVWDYLSSEARKIPHGPSSVAELRKLAISMVRRTNMRIDVDTIPYGTILLMENLRREAENSGSMQDMTRKIRARLMHEIDYGRIDFVGGPLTSFGPELKQACWEALEASTVALAFDTQAYMQAAGKPETRHMSTIYIPRKVELRVSSGNPVMVQDAFMGHHDAELEVISAVEGSRMKPVGDWRHSSGTRAEVRTALSNGMIVADYGVNARKAQCIRHSGT